MIHNYIKHSCRNWLNFEGRASRAEFWYHHLFYFLAVMILVIFIAIVKYIISLELVLILSIAPFCFMVISLISVYCRRLHDLGYSAWWLCVLLPILALIKIVSEALLNPSGEAVSLPILWIIGFIPGQSEKNKYGSPTKYN